MDTLLGIAVGIGLSAACGFRVFIPLLVMNLAAINGHLQLSPELAWLGTPYATLAFTTATIAEILAYYIPWVDHFLDMVAAPAAVIAGTIATASLVADVSPFWKWTMALIAGGGVAGLVQGTTSALRVASSLSTGGAANPLLSTMEMIGSLTTALLAILVPAAAIVLIALFGVFTLRRIFRRRCGHPVGSPACDKRAQC